MSPLINRVKSKLESQDNFLKSVTVLVGGTVFAQGLGVLALPFLTRLYTPSDFSLLAVYMSLVGIVAVVSNLRFEIAIPLPKDNSDALSLLMLSIISNLLITILLTIIIFFFKDSLIAIIKQPQIEPYLWLIPIGVFFSGLYNSFQFWSTRQKKFGIISRTRISQSISGVGAQLLLGFMGIAPLGLLLGHVINLSAGLLSLIKAFLEDFRNTYRYVSIKKIKSNLKKYQDFPKYSTFEALANHSAGQLPIIIIAAVAIGPEAGYLLLASRVMAIPVKLIGNAVSQVFLAHAPEEYSKGRMKSYTINCIVRIMKIGGLPLILICFISPFIFPIVFGKEWERAGEMVLWMLPWFLLQLITSPVSLSLHIMSLQKVALVLQIFGFALRVGGLLIFAKYFSSNVFEYYALSGFIFYLIYLIVILRYIRISDLTMKEV